MPLSLKLNSPVISPATSNTEPIATETSVISSWTSTTTQCTKNVMFSMSFNFYVLMSFKMSLILSSKGALWVVGGVAGSSNSSL